MRIYSCVHVNTHVQPHTLSFSYIHTFIDTKIYDVGIYISAFAYSYTYADDEIPDYVMAIVDLGYIYVYIYIYIFIYIYIYTYIYTYIYIFINVNIYIFLL